MIWVLVFLFICYLALILLLAIGIKKVKKFKYKNCVSKTNFSVIIPFRNEADNLPLLLASISKLNYPKKLCEFIFVNDASSDNSIEIIKNTAPNSFKILIINNQRKSNSPKKDAITAAIKKANHKWIVTTDADCVLPKNWLYILDHFIQKNNPKMVVGPVNYAVKDTFLDQFQLLDFISMQGTTIGGFGIHFPFMCNGANLAYQKDVFKTLHGFKGNNTIASGDDVFLLEKFIKSDKNAVCYLKSNKAIVTTFPLKTWRALINQRVRWASKTGNFTSIKVKLIGVLVFLVNASIVCSFFGSLWGKVSFTLLLVLFFLKLGIDLFLIGPTISYFEHEKSFWRWYLISSFFYPFFTFWVIFKSVFFKFEWKGRVFKK